MQTVFAFERAQVEGVAHRVGRSLRTAAAAIPATLIKWQERAEQRHALAAMSERIQKDLGLTQADIAAESRKPFWRA
jgi:uncharacterized protein YjiS (DUF1127 family)